MSTTASTTTTFRPGLLRTGLVLGTLIQLSAVPPATFEIGLDGSAWDVLVVFLAIFAPVVALASLILTVLAWKGAPAPCRWFTILQFISILQCLPAFVLFFVDGLPLIAPITSVIGIGLILLAVFLVSKGRQNAQ